MIYYFYNETQYTITLNGRSMDEMITAQKIQGVSTGDRCIIKTALALSPKSWTKAVILEEAPFIKSFYEGQLKSLVEKGQVRVLTETEYKDECKKTKLESDTGILHQDTKISAVSVFRKAAEYNDELRKQEKFCSYADLFVDDCAIKEEPIETQTHKETKNEYSDRLDKIETTISELTGSLATLIEKFSQQATYKKKSKKTSKKKKI